MFVSHASCIVWIKHAPHSWPLYLGLICNFFFSSSLYHIYSFPCVLLLYALSLFFRTWLFFHMLTPGLLFFVSFRAAHFWYVACRCLLFEVNMKRNSFCFHIVTYFQMMKSVLVKVTNYVYIEMNKPQAKGRASASALTHNFSKQGYNVTCVTYLKKYLSYLIEHLKVRRYLTSRPGVKGLAGA